MKVDLAYYQSSRLQAAGATQLLSLAPNLARPPVAFDAPLAKPLRFREAMSALHAVVTSDLRYQPRDHTAYLAWREAEKRRQLEEYAARYHHARGEIEARRKQPIPAGLEESYGSARSKYWSARQKYANFLFRSDLSLWRRLMPCDPVITVADDVVFFECFSADESSYGSLSVARDDGFGRAELAQAGTTNVDYSQSLYEHFQSLRSYRETRLKVDPAGFEVATHGGADYREEKIDLPPSWLQGFMQLQSAMSLPLRKVRLSTAAVYSLIAYLKRHRARQSPRAIRFELTPGRAPRLVLEPWGQTIDSYGTKYDGPETEPIRVWGRNRLAVLARLLPIAEHFDVYLLGNGLPSFWVAALGEMQFTLGLSGWTTNDWTRAAALDLLLPAQSPPPQLVQHLLEHLARTQRARMDELVAASVGDPAMCLAALNRLAKSGQVIYDLPAGVYRWRPVLKEPVPLADAGSEHPELAGSQKILARGSVQIESTERTKRGGWTWKGKADGCAVETTVDAEGRIASGTCVCSYYRQAGLKKGPCRHMLALRATASRPAAAELSWYERLIRWSRN